MMAGGTPGSMGSVGMSGFTQIMQTSTPGHTITASANALKRKLDDDDYDT